MNDWDNVRFFLNAVRAGSYTAAANRLQVNRTTVGRRLAQLEEIVGLPLYEQNEKGYQPTPVGQILLDAGHEMEQIIAGAMGQLDRLRHERVGRARIATSAGLGLEFMPEFLGFQSETPDVRVEFLETRDAAQSLLRRRADLGLCVMTQRPAHLRGVLIGRLEQALYASRDHVARYGAAALKNRIGWGATVRSMPDRWVRLNSLETGAAVLEVNSWAAMRQAVLDGCGAAWLWTFAADQHPNLVRLKPESAAGHANLWLVHCADVPLDPSTKALADFLVTAIGRRLESSNKYIR